MSKFKNNIDKRRGKKRSVDTIRQYPRILIVCEGEKTEPNYFKGFKVGNEIRVVIEGQAGNTTSLVTEADRIVRVGEYRIKTPEETQDIDSIFIPQLVDRNFDEEGFEYDSVWCVFDRDSFPSGNFNNAIDMCRQRGYHAIYTNEAFELWYLLHYEYHVSALSRTQYAAKLTESMGAQYKKNSNDMYGILSEKQSKAIGRAKKLLNEYGMDLNPERDNPCTTVHILVEYLNRFSVSKATAR